MAVESNWTAYQIFGSGHEYFMRGSKYFDRVRIFGTGVRIFGTGVRIFGIGVPIYWKIRHKDVCYSFSAKEHMLWTINMLLW